MIRGMFDKALDVLLSIAAFVFVKGGPVVELVSFAAVVYGISLIYTPAGWIAAGVALWLVARGMDTQDVA